MNTVTVVGRVGRDASENFNAYDSGKMKAGFSVAVNRWDSKFKIRSYRTGSTLKSGINKLNLPQNMSKRQTCSSGWQNCKQTLG